MNDMDKKTLTFPLDRIADKNERLAAVEALNRILSDIKGDVFIGSCSCIYVPNVTHTECELLWDDLNPASFLKRNTIAFVCCSAIVSALAKRCT